MSGTATELTQRAARFQIFEIANPPVDPYPVLDDLRREQPIAWSEELGGFWIVTRYEDALKVVRDPETFSSRHNNIPIEHNTQRVFGVPIPLNVDRPDHTTWRRILEPMFAPKVVATYEDAVRDKARTLLGGLQGKRELDVVAAFAAPFPAVFLLPMLGLDAGEVDELLALHYEQLTVSRVGYGADESVTLSRAAGERLKEKLNAIVDEHAAAADPPDDLVTGLLRADFGGRSVERAEMLSVLSFLFGAGIDTTKNTLTFGTWYLATNPADRRRLVDDPTLIRSAVEEFLRYFAIVQTGRYVTRDVELGGVELKAGDMVLLPLWSINRDERRFEHAGTLDLARSSNAHIGFGAGPHRCLGSHLARLELRIGFEELLSAFPDFELAPGADPEWHGGVVGGAKRLVLRVPAPTA